MNTNILLIEDNQDLGSVLKGYLEFSNIQVTWFSHPQQFIQSNIDLTTFDLAILDVMLPEIDGFELSKILVQKSTIPFIFLTAKGQSIDRIFGLKLGAEDYIVKPCEPEELLLRINNILKRNKSKVQDKIILGTYIFFPQKLELKNENKTYQLTEKEADLLHLLYKHNNRVLNRKTILEEVWGENDYFLGRSLDVFMTRLRKYLRNDSRIKLETIRGVGVKIEFPE